MTGLQKNSNILAKKQGPASASSNGIFQRNAVAAKKSQLTKDEDGQINYVVTKQPTKNQNNETSNKISSEK